MRTEAAASPAFLEVKVAIIIDGRKVAAEVRARVLEGSREFTAKYGRAPSLTVIRVGDDPASAVYVRNKMRACEEVGFVSECCHLPADISDKALLEEIEKRNNDDEVDGILLQLPIPRGLDEAGAIAAIASEKDVDAFGNLDAGHLCFSDSEILPCTPSGIMELLRSYDIPISGRECVVIGRSNIVGRPMAALLLAADGTVTVCHSRTRDLGEVTRRADILVSAVGRAGLVTADMVKPGATVIDVGMNRNAEGKLCGDVDFASVEPVAGYITPVPGGVGPMTVAMLMQNTLTAAKGRKSK